MLSLDLDDLDRLGRTLKLFAYNRVSLFGFFDRDHGCSRDQALRPQIENQLSSACLEPDGGAIILLTMPRVLNYVFNPLSLYFCYRLHGELAAIVYEVSNTFGERHFYTMPAHINDRRVQQGCEKAFFVSPFLDHDLHYTFDVLTPGDIFSVPITVRRGEDIVLTASFAGRRRELTDANIIRVWVGNPLMTLMVIAGIHWEALKMLTKGIPYRGRGAGPRPHETAK